MPNLPTELEINLNEVDTSQCLWTIVTTYLKNKYGYDKHLGFGVQPNPEKNVLVVKDIIWIEN